MGIATGEGVVGARVVVVGAAVVGALVVVVVGGFVVTVVFLAVVFVVAAAFFVVGDASCSQKPSKLVDVATPRVDSDTLTDVHVFTGKKVVGLGSMATVWPAAPTVACTCSATVATLLGLM